MKHHREVPALKPRPTDIQMIIRDGMVNLKTPNHDRDASVPQDYLVALGFSIAFRDPQFRKMMLAIVNQQHAQGLLGDVITPHSVN